MGIGINTGFGISSRNPNRRVIKLKNPDGTSAGTITISAPAKKKPKSIQYNFKRVSSKILAATTSGSARQVIISARSQVTMLQQKMLKSSDYDFRELRNALEHAMKMERIARKRMKHLEQEEKIKRDSSSGGMDEDIDEEELLQMEQADKTGELELSKEEMEKLMQELQKLMEESLQELEGEIGLDELSDELAAPSYKEMEPEDLESLKKKHRAEELREIMEADMKYLRALFDKLEQDRREAASAASSGVSLELSGVEMPVEVIEMPVPAEGGNINTSV